MSGISSLESLKYFFRPVPKRLSPYLSSTLGKRKHLMGDLSPVVPLPITADIQSIHHTLFLMGGICLERHGHLHLTESSSVLVLFQILLPPCRGYVGKRRQRGKVAGREDLLGKDGEFDYPFSWHSNALPFSP